jgi:hypothetical protein
MRPWLYVTVPYTLLQEERFLKCSPATGVNILLDAATINIAVLLNFIQKNNIDFTLSLSTSVLNRSADDVLFRTLFMLYTLSDNAGEAIKKIFLFTDDGNYAPENLEKLKVFFEQQGEPAVRFIAAEPGTNHVQENILFCTRTHLIGLNDVHVETYLSHAIEKVIVWYDDSIWAAGTKAVAPDTLSNYNRHAATFFNVVAHNSIAELYRNQSRLWKDRAMLYLNFIVLGKRISQNEYYGIKDWYNKEYEILPLWYKRFGHIIKVFLGKRSFSSLFDDKKPK